MISYKIYFFDLVDMDQKSKYGPPSQNKNPNVDKHLSYLHDKYVVVTADKAPNNIILCVNHNYIDWLIKELGIDQSLSNPIYTPKILDNRRSTKNEELDLTSTGYLHLYIALVSVQTSLYL